MEGFSTPPPPPILLGNDTWAIGVWFGKSCFQSTWFNYTEDARSSPPQPSIGHCYSTAESCSPICNIFVGKSGVYRCACTKSPLALPSGLRWGSPACSPVSAARWGLGSEKHEGSGLLGVEGP